MEVEKVSLLFVGKSLIKGLSNERELSELCPAEFQRENPWSPYVRQIFGRGATITNWRKWKSADETERRNQLVLFRALFERSSLRSKERQALACWMLSEMLSEVPEYLPAHDDR